MTVTPQRLQELRAQSALLPCESCGRYLYWLPDAVPSPLRGEGRSEGESPMASPSLPVIQIYTDGACSGNPAPAAGPPS